LDWRIEEEGSEGKGQGEAAFWNAGVNWLSHKARYSYSQFPKSSLSLVSDWRCFPAWLQILDGNILSSWYWPCDHGQDRSDIANMVDIQPHGQFW